MLIKIARRIHRMIDYDGAALLMLEFCVFAAVLYGVILPIAKRRIKMLLGGDFTLKIVEKRQFFINFVMQVILRRDYKLIDEPKLIY